MHRIKIIKNRCSLCASDMSKHKDDGGCICCKKRAHNIGGKSTVNNYCKTLDLLDGYYDGYGLYDKIRAQEQNA